MRSRRKTGAAAARGAIVPVVLAALAITAPANPASSVAGLADDEHASLAWLGCWRPEAAGQDPAAAAGGVVPLVCVAPGEAKNALWRVTRAGAQILSEEALHVDGLRSKLDSGGCAGWGSARFSPGGARLYTRSALRCIGGTERETSGLSMLTAPDEWLEISVARVHTGRKLSIQRYRAVSAGTGRPPLDVTTAIESARIRASAPLTPADVIEALDHADPIAVEAMLVESQSRFALTSEVLLTLVEEDVPAPIVDLMVALSFPDYFVIDELSNTPRRVVPGIPGPYRPWGVGYHLWYGWGYGYGYYGYWGGYGGYYPHYPTAYRGGRAIKGRGYTSVRPSGLPAGGLPRLLEGGGQKRSPSATSGADTVTRSGHSSGGGRSSRRAKPRD